MIGVFGMDVLVFGVCTLTLLIVASAIFLYVMSSIYKRRTTLYFSRKLPAPSFFEYIN